MIAHDVRSERVRRPRRPAGYGTPAVRPRGRVLPKRGIGTLSWHHALLHRQRAQRMNANGTRRTFPQADQALAGSRHDGIPAGGVCQRRAQQRAHIDGRGQRRLLTGDQCAVERHRRMKPPDLELRLAFDIQRSRSGQLAGEARLEQIGRSPPSTAARRIARRRNGTDRTESARRSRPGRKC